MPTLSDLLQAPARSEVLAKLLALYRLAGFPVASWQSGSVARHLTEASATVLADLNSRTGVFVRIKGEQELVFGDEFIVGRTRLIVAPPT